MKLTLWMVLLVPMTLCGFAFDDTSKSSLAVGIFNGAIAGAAAALLGWLKNRDPKGGDMEKFEVKHAIPTVIVGVLVGAMSGWNKETPNFEAWMKMFQTTAPAVIFWEILWKVVYRNGAPVVAGGVSMIMSAGKKPDNGGTP